MGDAALHENTTGYDNVGIGTYSLYDNVSGNNNVAIGVLSLGNNVTGNNNIAIGQLALYNNTNISHLVAIGDSALYNNGTGVSDDYHGTANTAVGYKTLFANQTGFQNTALGYQALMNNASNFNTAVGAYALAINSNGVRNTAVGAEALMANTSGQDNTAMGTVALQNNTQGSSNSAFGYYALANNTTGNNNTALGDNAGFFNQHGSGNVFIGHKAGYHETGSNKLYISNTDTIHPLIYGDFSEKYVQINGKLEGSDSGNADMKAYIYGSVDRFGNKITGASSAGFSVSKTATGSYRITFDNPPGDYNRYIVTANVRFAHVKFITIDKYATHFDVYIYNTDGTTKSDDYFDFVVYKK